MATTTWTKVPFQGRGDIYTTTISTGDESVPLTMQHAEDDVSVQITGTVGGSTVTIQQSLDGTLWSSAEGQAGSALALTTIGVVKKVVTVAPMMRITVSSGTASGLVVNVMIPHKTRP